jgi:acetyl esterase/lipase
MTTSIRRPPYDPDVASALEAMRADGLPVTLTAELIAERRAAVAVEDLDAFDVQRRDLTVPGYQGAGLTVSVFARPGRTGTGPGILFLHGGGMVMGNRLSGMSQVLPWVLDHDAVAVTVEYRLAPEHPDPFPVEDCYAALLWVAENADALGVDPARIVIAGISAGGGLAAGTALLVRDRNGPPLLGQMLIYPMLDDRDDTVSARQFDGVGLWDRGSNSTGWTALLGDRRGTDQVSCYAAPARATDLSGLPPAYIEAGSAEVFRDEDVAYAGRIWADGGVAELHIWPGGTHTWEQIAPHSPMARHAIETRARWMARLLRSGRESWRSFLPS